MKSCKQFYRGFISLCSSRRGLPLLLSFSAAIRLIGIGSEAYWYDESFTALIANLPIDRALVAIAGDVHPPLWYAIEWLIARVFGTGQVAMRTPSALFGVLAVWQIYELVSKLHKRPIALISAAMVSIMPAQLYYSQEARSYALLTWLVLFCMTAIISQSWLRAALSLVLLMYVHNLAILYVLPLSIWFLLSAKGNALRYAPIGAAYLPWLITAAYQAASVGSGFWIIAHNPGQIVYQLVVTTLFVRLPEWLQIHATITVAVFSVISLFVNIREKRLRPIIAFAWIPPILMYLVSVVWKPVYLERALLPSGALQCVLWAAAILKFGKRSRWQLSAIGVPVLIFSLIGFFVVNRQDYELIANEIGARVQEKDAIYHTSIPSMIFLAQYMPDYDHYVLPNVGDLNQSLSEPTKIAMGIKQREQPMAYLEQKGYMRVWLLRTLTPASNQDRLADVNLIMSTYRVISEENLVDTRFGKLDLVLIDLRYHKTAIQKPYCAVPNGDPP